MWSSPPHLKHRLLCPNLQHLKHWVGLKLNKSTFACVQPILILLFFAFLTAALNGHCTHTVKRPLFNGLMAPTFTSSLIQPPFLAMTLITSSEEIASCRSTKRSSLLTTGLVILAWSYNTPCSLFLSFIALSAPFGPITLINRLPLAAFLIFV